MIPIKSELDRFYHNAITLNQEPSLRRTVVVFGPRGTGKTTLVQHALRNESQIMFIKASKTIDGALRSLLSSLGVTNIQMTPPSAFVHILENIPNTNDAPVFVFEIDEEWNPEEVTTLLILSKQMSSYASFVIVLSEAISVFSVMDRLRDLRGVPFLLEGLSEEIKREYLSMMLHDTLGKFCGSDFLPEGKHEGVSEL